MCKIINVTSVLAIVLALGGGSIARGQGGDRSVVLAYQTSSAPRIDGVIDPGEWDAAGPPIVVTADNGVFEDNIAEDVFGGVDDLSYQFRVMWEEPWTAYFLVEVNDDIAMDPESTRTWERDQVELFIDGNQIDGSTESADFAWWDGSQLFGKFSVSRENTFDGNTAAMTDDQDEVFADDFGYVAVAGMASETGPRANYIVEYAVSFEAMWFNGTFDGTPAGDAEQIVADATSVKFQAGVSDDDNYDTGDTERSHYIYYWRSDPSASWDQSATFSDLTFVGALDGTPALMAGDADMDLDFDQLDLVKVQIAAKYLTGQPATWGEGDWNGAPGGQAGDPPPGNGQFDQLDIIAALAPGHYLTGPYASIRPNGVADDAQASIVYDADTGEVSVDAPAGSELTSINIDSGAGIFTGDAAQNLGGSFDNDSDNNIFKATFGSSFGTLSFGTVAEAGLSEAFLLNDLTVVGSLAGGGALGDVDLIYVPEPSPAILLSIGLSFGLFYVRRTRGSSGGG